LTSKTLPFASEHIDAILDGRKWVTIRVDPDEAIRPGDLLELIEAESGEPFAAAKTTRVARAPADWIARQEWDGHRNYRTVGQLLNHLREYYPDADLSPQRELTLVVFENVQQAAGFDLGLDPREPRPEEVAHGRE
jgi:hypothetical protein